MKTRPLFPFLAIVMALSSFALHAKADTKEQVLDAARCTNDYFMRKYEDPTVEVHANKKVYQTNLWTRAVYYEGLMAFYDVDAQQRYLDYVDRWAEFHKWLPRRGADNLNADNQCCQQTYIDRYRQSGNKAAIANVDHNLRLQMATHKNDYWTWIDALQMTMPVYAKYAQLTGDRSFIDYAMKGYLWTRDTLAGGLFNEKDGLWWRDKDYAPPYTEKDGSQCYWSRGNGWVYAALLRVMQTLPAGDAYRKMLEKDYLKMSAALLKCQRTDGFWNVSLKCPANYGGPEMTGTALFLYGMAWGVNNGLLKDKQYRKAMDKAWKALKSCLHDDGFIGYNQGTGKDPSAGQPVTYTSVPDFEDYGTGCFLLGASEYYKLLAAEENKKANTTAKAVWPDGTRMDNWFLTAKKVDEASLGKRYVVTDYGVKQDSTLVQTAALQAVIDKCATEGGGAVVIPKGTFLSGSLFFRQGTNLLVEEGGKLKGSDRIRDFKIAMTRIEGQTCKYFTALVNADSLNGFTIAGKGTIDGNGSKYWEEFWIRRKWNPQCTNKDEQRPRLVYISNSQNVTVQDVKLQNSPFWTNHLYRSDHVRYLDCTIYAPTSGLKAPSSDAIDIDVCHDVLVSGCYMSVNDDAIAIKGGKGTWADKAPENGPNINILIEKCRYGVVHGCLTLGSESVNDHNIVLRDIQVNRANRVLWLKMRPDTPQHYEYVTIENITGTTGSLIVVRPWTQFFQKEERADMPLSQCNNIVMKNIHMDCKNFFDVGASDKYKLKDFTFSNVRVNDKKNGFNPSLVENLTADNLWINGEKK